MTPETTDSLDDDSLKRLVLQLLAQNKGPARPYRGAGSEVRPTAQDAEQLVAAAFARAERQRWRTAMAEEEMRSSAPANNADFELSAENTMGRVRLRRRFFCGELSLNFRESAQTSDKKRRTHFMRG
jgi:hypothetical protein